MPSITINFGNDPSQATPGTDPLQSLFGGLKRPISSLDDPATTSQTDAADMDKDRLKSLLDFDDIPLHRIFAILEKADEAIRKKRKRTS